MKTPYTPGPWYSDSEGTISTPYAGQGPRDMDMEIAVVSLHNKGKNEQQGNIDLIVNAPDVLEALAVCYQSFGNQMQASFRRHVRDVLMRATGNTFPSKKDTSTPEIYLCDFGDGQTAEYSTLELTGKPGQVCADCWARLAKAEGKQS